MLRRIVSVFALTVLLALSTGCTKWDPTGEKTALSAWSASYTASYTAASVAIEKQKLTAAEARDLAVQVAVIKQGTSDVIESGDIYSALQPICQATFLAKIKDPWKRVLAENLTAAGLRMAEKLIQDRPELSGNRLAWLPVVQRALDGLVDGLNAAADGAKQ